MIRDTGGVSNADDYLLLVEFERAVGWRFLRPVCATTVLESPVEVTCTYTMENAWSQALGVGPFTGSSFEFVIADGQIQEVGHRFDFTVFGPYANAVFLEWMTAVYPNDIDVMWDSTVRLTPEAIALFKQHTIEFETVQPGVNFVKARDRSDGEAVRALVTDDAVIDDLAVSNADDYLLVAEFEPATGWRYMRPVCTATVLEPPVEVNCTYTMENAWSQALGVGPFTGSSFEFVIADGQIQQIRHSFDSSQFSPQVFDVFLEWLTDAYPNDVDVMWDSSSGNALLTPEALALFEQHTTEFVSSLSNTGSG